MNFYVRNYSSQKVRISFILLKIVWPFWKQTLITMDWPSAVVREHSQTLVRNGRLVDTQVKG